MKEGSPKLSTIILTTGAFDDVDRLTFSILALMA